jgi:hypothetical protein
METEEFLPLLDLKKGEDMDEGELPIKINRFFARSQRVNQTVWGALC